MVNDCTIILPELDGVLGSLMTNLSNLLTDVEVPNQELPKLLLIFFHLKRLIRRIYLADRYSLLKSTKPVPLFSLKCSPFLFCFQRQRCIDNVQMEDMVHLSLWPCVRSSDRMIVFATFWVGFFVYCLFFLMLNINAFNMFNVLLFEADIRRNRFRLTWITQLPRLCYVYYFIW